MDRISVVTVVYNAEQTIERTIKSVLYQNYEEYEYVIVDGGSTDKTGEIINKYLGQFAKKGINVSYISEKDGGIFDAMNKAIKMIAEDSDWVNFLNADDRYCDKNVLRDLFEKTVDAKYGAVYGNTIIVRDNGQRYLKKALDINTINYRSPFVHQALFIRSKVIRDYPFCLEWGLATDYEQWVRMYIKGIVFKCVDRNVAVYNAEGYSGKNYDAFIVKMLEVQKTYGLNKKYRIRRFYRNRLIPLLKKSKLIYYLYARIKGEKKGKI